VAAAVEVSGGHSIGDHSSGGVGSTSGSEEMWDRIARATEERERQRGQEDVRQNYGGAGAPVWAGTGGGPRASLASCAQDVLDVCVLVVYF
jgi:hypothetical protein